MLALVNHLLVEILAFRYNISWIVLEIMRDVDLGFCCLFATFLYLSILIPLSQFQLYSIAGVSHSRPAGQMHPLLAMPTPGLAMGGNIMICHVATI